jgi:hypothetical protein
MNGPDGVSRLGPVVSAAAAVLLAVLFFLPWVEVNCAGPRGIGEQAGEPQTVKGALRASGWQLAVGTVTRYEVDPAGQVQPTDDPNLTAEANEAAQSRWWLLLGLLVPLLLGAVGAAGLFGNQNRQAAAKQMIVLSVLGVLVCLLAMATSFEDDFVALQVRREREHRLAEVRRNVRQQHLRKLRREARDELEKKHRRQVLEELRQQKLQAKRRQLEEAGNTPEQIAEAMAGLGKQIMAELKKGQDKNPEVREAMKARKDEIDAAMADKAAEIQAKLEDERPKIDREVRGRRQRIEEQLEQYAELVREQMEMSAGAGPQYVTHTKPALWISLGVYLVVLGTGLTVAISSRPSGAAGDTGETAEGAAAEAPQAGEGVAAEGPAAGQQAGKDETGPPAKPE